MLIRIQRVETMSVSLWMHDCSWSAGEGKTERHNLTHRAASTICVDAPSACTEEGESRGSLFWLWEETKPSEAHRIGPCRDIISAFGARCVCNSCQSY